ncbi:MAG: DUF356 domain-containing protein [Methanobrevibacter thaueri]|jgi:hypothetical protein|uniref:DUF356 domain-containing protein n=1 Tax=Methanobrevibacter thaueri TaxID=190975 RepID=UPI0026E9D02B|nr:DUF356 domain-containing protein [Methanobrevibacter thaueri]MBE6495494.1 DUF356 domain-containing protein [Methanobrevibacter thaueri]
MALILIRGENNSKLLSAISDIEQHGSLNIISSPKIVDPNFADTLVEGILKSELRTKSSAATAFFVKEDTTLSIMQVKKIHPPAHVVVVSDEYDAFSKLEYVLNNAEDFGQYHPAKAINDGMIDYKINKKERHIRNDKLNSYMK